jgi:ABC-type transporter Mla maintaining outer membrane lipid asymmetry ATPase subunit MlaF
LHGTGKTDFLMVAGGITAPHAGEYRLFGEPMPIFEESRQPLRLRLGLVFEGGRLFHQLTVFQNVCLPLRYQRDVPGSEVEEEVAGLLEAMGIAHLSEATPGSLGLGWRKRAALARALVLKPEVLLLDNPLTGLDVPQAQWWVAFLDELARGHPLVGARPITLVISTQDLRPFRLRADHFGVLRGGRLQVLGGRQDLPAAEPELLREVLAEGGGAH